MGDDAARRLIRAYGICRIQHELGLMVLMMCMCSEPAVMLPVRSAIYIA